MCQRHVAIVVVVPVQGINGKSQRRQQRSSNGSSNGTRRHLLYGKEKERENGKEALASCKMMTPFEDFVYLINHVLLGEEPVSNRNVHKI